MMKRMSAQLREENYEHVLMCLICRSLFDDYDHQPKFLPCHHTFCKDCLREYIKQTGDEIECPSCRKIATIPAAGVTALQTNFYVKYIQGLVQGPYGGDGNNTECSKHPNCPLTHYCKECQIAICSNCCKAPVDNAKGVKTCIQHEKVSLTTITEECHQKLDTSFAKANALIENKKVESEALLRALCQEKDQALLKIESTFEQHVHTLSRRSTLLKNKVIDIYNEHVSKLESDIEEISTAMTCVISLKEYHEGKIGHAQFEDTEKGISELEEVFENVSEKVKPCENHIVFEDKHGIEKFKIAVKDLGRVKTNRPIVPRTDPEGGRDAPIGSTSSQADTPSHASDSEFSPLHTAYDTGGATGTSLYLPPCQTLCSSIGPCDQLSSSMHQLMHTSQTLCDKGLSDKPDSLYRNSNNPNEIESNVYHPMEEMNIDPNANNNDDHGPIDPNSNHPTSQSEAFPVVRPKSLDTSPKTKKHSSSSTPKPLKAKYFTGPLREQKMDHSNCNHPLLSRVKEEYALKGDQPCSVPDVEALKKSDKAYHQLVYTSYDEEELLKELKINRIPLSDPNVSFIARMSESDSWMTASSVDDMVLSTGDDANLQQSSL